MCPSHIAFSVDLAVDEGPHISQCESSTQNDIRIELAKGADNAIIKMQSNFMARWLEVDAWQDLCVKGGLLYLPRPIVLSLSHDQYRELLDLLVKSGKEWDAIGGQNISYYGEFEHRSSSSRTTVSSLSSNFPSALSTMK